MGVKVGYAKLPLPASTTMWRRLVTSLPPGRILNRLNDTLLHLAKGTVRRLDLSF